MNDTPNNFTHAWVLLENNNGYAVRDPEVVMYMKNETARVYAWWGDTSLGAHQYMLTPAADQWEWVSSPRYARAYVQAGGRYIWINSPVLP
jgi:hypothetical protein